MSVDFQRQGDHPITQISELWTYFKGAERPSSEHQVGLEHEKLLYSANAPEPVRYEGPKGIGELFAALQQRGFTPFADTPDAPPIALLKGSSTVSLEPGGQLELSGTAAKTAREVHQENLAHLAELRELTSQLGLRMVALGYRPFVNLADMPWMPKARYEAMRKTLGVRGALALDMMLMTATGQVSFDWADEADCVRKVCTSARLGPLTVALFANSPLARGELTGYCSYRSRVWSEVDASRCGYLPSMIDSSFSYQAYVEWALDVPLLFLRREGRYATPKLTFRQLLEGGYEGKPAFAGDWNDHLSTLFPEIRIKRVLEIRGADCVNAALTGALAALWRGLLYDRQALDEAGKLLPRLSFAEHLAFQAMAQKNGLRGRLGKALISDLAKELVAIARRGLLRLDAADAPLLDPLAEVAEAGRSPSEIVLEEWEARKNPQVLLDRFRL